jgi:YVTN family beta-propeller protein
MKSLTNIPSRLTRSRQASSACLAVVLALCLPALGQTQEVLRNSAQEAKPDLTIPVVATITVGQLPASLVVSPDSKFVYVADLSGISVIDTATNQVSSTISVSGQPTGIAITPDGSTLYCAENGSNAVLQISTATQQVTNTYATGSDPQVPAVSPNGTLVYIPNETGTTVTVISNGELQSPIVCDGPPVYAIFTSDGTQAYVGVAKSHPEIVIVDTATGNITETIKPGNLPGASGFVLSPDGSKLYIPGGGSTYPTEIGVLNTAGDKIKPLIPLSKKRIDEPGFLGITPDGKYLLVPLEGRKGNPDNDDKVDIVDLVTQKRLPTQITVGYSPLAVAVAPDGSYAYVANYDSSNVSVLNISAE